MKNKLFILSTVSALSLYAFEAESKIYFGGGYQLLNLDFVSDEAKGTYIETTQEEIVTSKTKVDNGDGTFTTTIRSSIQDVQTPKVGVYLNYGDYFEKNIHNFNIFTGVQVSENHAFELGYYYNNLSKDNNNSNSYLFKGKTVKSDSKLQILSLDMVMRTPIIDDRADLNVILGGSMVDYQNKVDLYENNKFSESKNINQKRLGLNIGLGTDVFVTERISLRTQIKMTLIPDAHVVDRIIIGNVGIKIKI